MLGEVRKDGYGNQRIRHADRDFVTSNVTELLEQVLIFLDDLSSPIIPETDIISNPPDES